jgi:thiol reductant ABC exporter CydD subunit
MQIWDKQLSGLVKRHRRLFFLSIGSGLISAGLFLIQANLLSKIISGSFIDHRTRADLLPLLFSLTLVFTFRGFLSYCSDGLAKIMAARIKKDSRKVFFEKINRINPVQLKNMYSGELITLFLSGIDDLDKYFSEYLPQIIYAFCIPVLYLLFVFPRDVLSGTILLITAPLIPVFMILIGNRAEKLTQDQWDNFSRLGGHYLDTLRGLVTLKILSQSKPYAGTLEKINDAYRKDTIKVLKVTFLSAFVLEIIATISVAIIAVEIGLRLLYGTFSFQTAFVILLIVPEFYNPLRQLSLKFHASNRGLAASRRLFEFLRIEEWDNITRGTLSGERNEAENLKDILDNQFVIMYNRVSYQYPERNVPAVADISFEFNKGQHIAVVGETASGKSTLFNLFLKFIDPDFGEISINGLPIKNIDTKNWLSHIAYVSHRPYIFSGTISDNITMNKGLVDEDRIWQALIRAQLDNWVKSLEKGIHTKVGEDGFGLSSGQSQRLVLARAFFKNAPIMVMDEPTSAVDPETEMFLQNSHRLLSEGKTVFSIAHRLATVYRADTILVMKNGRLIERGSHSNLMDLKGSYFQMVKNYGSVS